jgi:hypothetical protein
MDIPVVEEADTQLATGSAGPAIEKQPDEKVQTRRY